ncbi:MAG: nitrous oxide reductase family maturation protein NosD [Candidatus Eremiobacteraeota bacterium]|nr:nitrous oxide reductase family maturation protein NosD [Candidatus Eremiobacteraeota bacterium]MCW5869899.1 nitrous oxide reductase family maturation protein NosD [Candidatus Eremiobacteraeota bacterium]
MKRWLAWLLLTVPALGRPVSDDRQLQQALAQATPGETIEVLPGHYRGPLILNRPVRLLGQGWPVIDGHGQGTIITVNAADCHIEGLVIRNSGSEPELDHAGVTLNQPRARVKNNRFENVLFGIFVARSDDSLISGNDIASQQRYDLGRRGDSVRVWYSKRVQVLDNYAHHSRDLVAWYSSDLIMRGNRVEGGRYGLHFMYCDGARVEGNLLKDNSVGIYTMYSQGLKLESNRVIGCRGASGYGLGFKDAGDVTVRNNILCDNRAGIFVDSTPLKPDSYARFEDNVVAYNDIGVALFPSVSGAQFSGNRFHENYEQVSLEGGGQQKGNDFGGNYWSDYAGCDLDGDGRGDLPYRAERLFERLADHNPKLRLFTQTPLQEALDSAARMFPLVNPQAKLEDSAPLISAGVLPAPEPQPAARAHWLWLSTLVALALVTGRLPALRKVERKRAMSTSLRIQRVNKSYGPNQILKDLCLELEPGRALALWGPNGAGKTTVIRCLLDLIEYEGEIYLGAYSCRRQGRQARGLLGYVPQELNFHDDLGVLETMEFYAVLRSAAVDSIGPLLAQVGLAEVGQRKVGQLSGGMRQRLALALALLGDPPLLVLDEPTSNLDAEARDGFLNLLQQLRQQGKSLLFTTHRREEVLRLADQVALLQAGSPARLCAPADLQTHNLKILLAGEQLDSAVQVLRRDGFQPARNGSGVYVEVARDAKAAPIQALFSAGIPVLDFEI